MIEKINSETFDSFHDFEKRHPHLKPRYYDMDGKEISMSDWSLYLSDVTLNRHIGDDRIDGFRISTVWLGLDHRFRCVPNNDLPPLIFETMIFLDHEKESEKGDQFSYYMERYSTKEEALEGHKIACQLVREKPKQNSIS